jgi:hypothetical protein
MSSRQRLLAALSCEQTNAIPCAFMLFNGLKDESCDYLDFIQRQLDLGLDAYVEIPPRPKVVKNDHYNLHGLPVSYHPDVRIKEWKETQDDQPYPMLIKEYHTPAGVLRAEIRQDDEWRWGDHVPFLDDYLVGRSKKFIVDGPAELNALRYLLVPPTQEEIANFKADSSPVLEFARKNDLLVVGGWGVGADLTGWVYGLQRLPYAVFDQPEFIAELLDIIARWNRTRTEILLQAGIDLLFKRAWYENCDNFTPRHFRQLIKPILAADVAQAHQYGAKFGYVITSNCMPLLDDIRETGVDVIIGADPAQWNLEAAHQKLAGRVCVWGGVNGHLTVEMGKPEDVRAEVQKAMEIFSPGGGFILSPVDNVREYTPTARTNVAALISAWKQFTNKS